MKKPFLLLVVGLILGAAGAGYGVWTLCAAKTAEKQGTIDRELAEAKEKAKSLQEQLGVWQNKAVEFEQRLTSEAARLQQEFTDQKKAIEDKLESAQQQAKEFGDQLTQQASTFADQTKAMADREQERLAAATASAKAEANEAVAKAMAEKDAALKASEAKIEKLQKQVKDLQADIVRLTEQLKLLNKLGN